MSLITAGSDANKQAAMTMLRTIEANRQYNNDEDDHNNN